ncbi:LuxR C-terminal-related transcriptional regulator [Cohnella hongkongensis]|uniref:LuxR C-terminal-related transcriptional regulator n=1 Tax=Cohnella hongkongensis TaxID=178337 RepID=A0ABV9FIR5_9BACL
MIMTKMEVPGISRDHITRPRLLSQLDQAFFNKVTLLCAPAGYGKTSLAVSWVREQRQPVAWLSLDARDNDLMRFWSYVASSLTDGYSLLDSQLPLLFINKAPGSCEQGLAILLNELNRHSAADDMVILLDDYHVITMPDIHETLAYFIQQMPVHMHLILLSRTDPPLPLSRLLATDQLKRLSHEDLRFSDEEAAAFFRIRLDTEADNVKIVDWVNKTEGWIVGMQLAALSFQQKELHSAPRGEEWPITDYLWEEVFEQQPEDVQAFLLKTSFLPRICASLCDRVTGWPNSQSMMEYIDKNQLFLISLDRRKEWFRYHHLFSDFLQDRLRKRERDELADLYAAAAAWFEEHGYDEDAIEQYFAASQPDNAATIILRLLPSKLKQEWSTLAVWLEKLPDDRLRQYPRLYLTYIFLICLHGKIEEAEHLLSLWEELRAELVGRWSTEEAEQLYADSLVIRIYIATERSDVAATTGYILQYFQEIREDGLFLFVNHKFNSISTMRHDPKVEGKPSQAEVFFGQLLQHAADSQTLGRAICAHGYAEAIYEWNRLEEAQRYADASLAIGLKCGHEGIIVLAAILLSRIRLAKGDVSAHLRIIAEVEQHPAVAANPYWMNCLKLHRLCIDLKGAEAQAISVRWLNDHPQSVAWKEADHLPGWSVLESITRARAMIGAKQYDEAQAWLERLAEHIQKDGFLLDKIEVLLLQSFIFFYRQDLKAAVHLFSKALQLAVPEKLIRLFVDEGEVAALILAEYMRLRQLKHMRVPDGVPMQYVKRLAIEFELAHSIPTEAHNLHRDLAPKLTTPITRKEAKVLELICLGLPNTRIAEELGIGVGTVKTHIHRIYGKLGVSSRFEAARKSKELRLIQE